jgi:drug/metabolite transporter (DMT)-like permease
MLVLLAGYLYFSKGKKFLSEILAVFLQYWLFWIMAGSIGFGVFYSLLSFSASFAPSWIIATTWQTTILATPIVLIAFGKKVPFKGVIFTGLIFTGIVLVNVAYATKATTHDALLGVIPILIAAIAYPIGNQMVWESTQKGYKLIPYIDHRVMQDSFARVLLLTMGSIPFWLVLLASVNPQPPSAGQLVSTALVAMFSGVVATTIFLYARHLCMHPYEIAAVDATQSMEVVFSLVGEVLILKGTIPSSVSVAGIALTIIGLVAYTRQHYTT